MSGTATPEIDVAMVAAEYLAVSDVLEGGHPTAWDLPSLCVGWRVREVIAHVTMPVRYPPERFMEELAACDGDFGNLSDRIAARDAELPIGDLLADLRDAGLHTWQPPGGGAMGALTHIVIHGLDVTLPLGAPRRAPLATLRTVLDGLTSAGAPSHFGIVLDGIRLEADDLGWSVGAGPTVSAPAEHLVAMLAGRRLPAEVAGDGPSHLPQV